MPSPSIVVEFRVSTCLENNVEYLREQFHLLADKTTRAMTAEKCSNRPPYPLVAFNKAIMKHEARLPLHPFVRWVLAHFGLSPN